LPTVVAMPVEAPIVAIVGSRIVQFTIVVMLAIEPLLYVPVAVNAWVDPSAMVAELGLISIDVSVAAETWTIVVSVSPLAVAVIVALPVLSPVTMPAGEVVVTVATEVFEDDHTAVSVTSCIVPLLSVSVAVRSTVRPSPTVGLSGVITSVIGVAGVTVTDEEPLLPSSSAVTVVVGGEGGAFAAVTVPPLTVATLVFWLVHVAWAVMSLVVLSE
jgi:hypothetical protein